MSDNDIRYNLEQEIDNVLNDINRRTPVKLRNNTPQILVSIGIKDLPMYENPSHIRKNILTEKEARKINLVITQRDHYHGLGKTIYIEVINSLDTPRVIFENKNKSDYLILTSIKDKNNKNILVPIKIEDKTYVNNVEIDITRVKSVYGYDRSKPDLNTYFKKNINNGNFTKIYEQKKEPSTGKIPQSALFLKIIYHNLLLMSIRFAYYLLI